MVVEHLEYNTERPQLIIPEYGRHIQKMVNHCRDLAGVPRNVFFEERQRRELAASRRVLHSQLVGLFFRESGAFERWV